MYNYLIINYQLMINQKYESFLYVFKPYFEI